MKLALRCSVLMLVLLASAMLFSCSLPQPKESSSDIQSSIAEEEQLPPSSVPNSAVLLPALVPAAEEMPVFYDFTFDQNGSYSEESLFPVPEVLDQLKREWETQWLSDENKELTEYEYLQLRKEQGDTCSLIWAFTGDCDSDGFDETYFCYGAEISCFLDAMSIYFMDQDGIPVLLDSMPYCDFRLLRYPNQIHLAYLTDHGTGLSVYAQVYGCGAGGAELLLNTHYDGFQKEGAYLTSFPRVGSAGDVAVHCYYWVAEIGAYQESPCVEISLTELPDGIPTIRNNERNSEESSLSRAATVAGRYFYASYTCTQTDAINPEYLQLYYLEDDGSLTKISSFYPYSIDNLLESKDGVPVHFTLAEQSMLPARDTSPILAEELERALQFAGTHLAIDELQGDDRLPVLSKLTCNGVELYQLEFTKQNRRNAFYGEVYYFPMNFSELWKTNLLEGNVLIWSIANTDSVQ